MPFRRAQRLTSQLIQVFKRSGVRGLYGFILTKLWLLRESVLHGQAEYQRWIQIHSDDPAPPPSHSTIKISIVTPVFNPPIDVLRDTIESVLAQTSSNWEFILANAGETTTDVGQAIVDLIEQTAQGDPRVKSIAIGSNLGISCNLNLAVEHAVGDAVVVLDHDDTLDRNAIAEIVQAFESNPNADIVYYDEDRLTADGKTRCQPWFKPGTSSPEYLLNACYLMHSAIRLSSLLNVGGFRSEMDGAQDWDLYLRLVRTGATEVHVPKILYHWRQTPGSAAVSGDAKPWALEAQERAISEHLKEIAGVDAKIVRDKRGLLRPMWELTRPSVQIVIHHNRILCNVDWTELASDWIKFSPIQSFADIAKSCDTELVLFIENTVGGSDKSWLTELARWGMLPEAGIVGGQLFDPHGFTLSAGLRYSPNGISPLFCTAPVPCHTPYGSIQHVRNCTSVPLSCLMIRREILFQCDPSIWNRPLPELALSEMARALGYRTIITPHVELTLPMVFNTSVKLKQTIDPYYNPNLDPLSSVPRLNMARTHHNRR